MPTTAAFRLPTLVVFGASCLLLALPACGKSGNTAGKSQSKQRQVEFKVEGTAKPNAVTANIAKFDPNADMVLDINGGTARPDDYAVQEAFFGQFGALDECVWAEKDRRGSEDQLPGDVTISVKLNPEGSTPFGVNADMPERLAKAEKLETCMREAAAGAPYPTYDGPPLIVEFETEIDPGYE